jgi:SAM-dependent methyltransferase
MHTAWGSECLVMEMRCTGTLVNELIDGRILAIDLYAKFPALRGFSSGSASSLGILKENPPGEAMVWPMRDHRAYVSSNPGIYDFEGANQFNLLTLLGLREDQYLLDIGCGSLRAGRLLIPYLQRGHYYGLEPDQKLVQSGVQLELGNDLVQLRQPVFAYNTDFRLDFEHPLFDFILAYSIFSHASREQILQCLKLVKGTLADKGIFLATYFAGNESYSGSNWVYPGSVEYQPADMVGMVVQSGLSATEIDWPQPKGQRWMMIAKDESVLAQFTPPESGRHLVERAAYAVVSKLYQDITLDPLYRVMLRTRSVLTQLGFRKPGSPGK